jgi:hypothetical protein
VEFAKFEFNLDLTIIEKASLREHLKAAKAVDQLKNPTPFPELLTDQWEWFCELSATGRGASATALTSTEILAWSTLRNVQLLPWEIRLIRLLDTTWLRALRA